MPRENGMRFVSKGIRTGSPADALTPGEFPYLQNVRGNTDTELETRAGHVLKFATAGSPVKNVSSYTQGTTPRYLAAVATDVYLDTGAIVDTGYGTDIPSMLPFRPSASPAPWMYVGDSTQYRKLSAPSATNVVTAQNAGIAEPQDPPGVVLFEAPANILNPQDPAAFWTNSGACSAVSNGTRSTDTILGIFRDPLSFASEGTGTVTLQVGANIIYQRDESITPVGRVNDVFTPLPAGLKIAAIYYFSGVTGKCIVVPELLAEGEQSIFEEQVIASLRRGALVQIGTEVCYVLDVEVGPFGGISFTTTTVNPHTAADALGGVAAIQVFRSTLVDALIVGQTITSYQWQFHAGSGIGSVQQNAVAGLFLDLADGIPFQPDDYFCFGIYMPNPQNLIEMKVIINVTAGGVNYTEDAYFYAVRPSDIEAGLQNTLTQLGVGQLYTQRQLIEEESQVTGVSASTQAVPGANQWSQIAIRIRDLVRIGSDESQTLLDMLGIQFLFNCTGAGTDVAISSIITRGQRQLDVGTIGQPMLYRVRGRSSVTGAKSNPSPPTRYGWSPRRQANILFLPSVPDPQMDLWDIFRIGGTLDTYRLTGTVSTTDTWDGNPGANSFYDDYDDVTIGQSEVLEFDNLQPWPTLDNPLSVPSATTDGYIINFTLAGGDPQLLTIPRYLPGNLVRVNQTVYTLYNRPVVVGTAVTMQIVENAGSVIGPLFIYEPLMANQPLPFLWGPDEFGVVFGVGDPNRPGNVYFAKPYNPDSAPDKRNLEITPPSEPLTGGVLHNGESLSCSLDHWWALRPAFSGPNAYVQRLIPAVEGAVSHFAICSDGKDVFFVGRSGPQTLSGRRLVTRENIESLFPQEGVPGQPWTYAGFTVYPPDYTKTAQFRLSVANGFLYFDYPDTNGGTSHLVCDLVHNAWYIDKFQDIGPTMHYSVPQQDPSADTFVLVGDTAGNVLVETPAVKDNGIAIACVVATRELCPGGWAWSWFENPGVDLLPTNATALSAQGVSLGIPIGVPTTFQSASRITQGIVSLGGGLPLKSLGVMFSWSQTYGAGETVPVTLYLMETVAVPYPEPILAQKTKGTSHGFKGFQHLYLGQLAFIPVGQPITLTFQPDQGAAFTVTIPAQPIVPYPVKFSFKVPANKWKMLGYEVACPTQFYLWPESCEMWIKQWGSAGEYQVVRPWGGNGEEPIA